MPAPDDAETVLAAVRLGFCMAEVRGWNRPGSRPGVSGFIRYPRFSHELPLQFERTPAESRIAAQALLGALASKLGVDTSTDGSSYSKEVALQARRLAEVQGAEVQTEGNAELAAQWHSLAQLIYVFDAEIQDKLSVQSDLQAGGYQLGRALAECYWALDPTLSEDVKSWASWSSLLGPERCEEIESLLGRLSAYLPAYAARAITGSVGQWKEVAASSRWRQGAYPTLYEQVSIWYELAALGRDPDTYVKAYARVRNSRIAAQAVRFFWGQMLLITLGITALIVLILLLGSGSSTAVINTVLGIVAAAGVSTAGLSAGRFRRDLNIDMLTNAITKLPPRPGRGRGAE